MQLLRCAFYWLCAGLSARSILVVVGHYSACDYRSAVYRKDHVALRIKRWLGVRRELRRTSNEATLRAFRNPDRFTTFKIFRRPGAL